MFKHLLLPALLLCGYVVPAQYPDLTTYTVSPMSSTSFTEFAEVPPWIIAGGWRSYFFNNGIGSTVMSTPASIIGSTFIDKNAGPNTTSNPYAPFYNALGKSYCPGTGQDWKRDYYGIYSAQYITHPTQGTINLGFLHAENRNITTDYGFCSNTINVDGSQVEDFLHYNGFLDAAWVPNTAATNWGQQLFSNEMGPISWPSTGYLQSNGVKATCGLRHPSSIVWGGAVYVFYVDSGPYGGVNPNVEEGRMGGIKMVMAPVSDCLNPYAYKAYYRDPSGNESWNPSLPAGFTKEAVLNYLYAPGPKASDILNGDGERDAETRFSVAQVRNTNYFIGVEEYREYATNTDHVALRFSSDLRHWTERKRIIYDGPYGGGWAGDIHYPVFLSNDGWSNNVVDANDFWVLGSPTNMSKIVNKIEVHIPSPPPPPPPPPPPCNGNLNYQKCPAASTGEAASLAALDLDESTGAAPGVYPNPGRGVYQLNYTLKDHAVTQLNVMDMTGRRLRADAEVLRARGRVTETVDISAQAKGIYLLELLVNGGKKTFKVIYE